MRSPLANVAGPIPAPVLLDISTVQVNGVPGVTLPPASLDLTADRFGAPPLTLAELGFLPASASAPRPSGSTVAVLARPPIAVGVTTMVTAKLPVVAPIVTAQPPAEPASTSLPRTGEPVLAGL